MSLAFHAVINLATEVGLRHTVWRVQAVWDRRELGPDALHAFTDVKNVFIATND